MNAAPQTDANDRGAPGVVHAWTARLVALGSGGDGRILAAACVGAYLFVVAAIRLLTGVDPWPALGVPAAPSAFFDTRVLTSALECRRIGLDPLTNNPCDPAGRPFNYPRVWLLLRWLGLNQSHTVVLGILFVLLFLVALFFLLGRTTLGEGIVVAVAVCSPSVMFGIERGNTDIVVFAILAASVLMWRGRPRDGAATSPLVVLVAAVLKIYPAFALGSFAITARRRAALVAAASVAAFLAYAVFFRSDLAAITRATPQGTENAYGVRILPAAIYHRLVAAGWSGGGAAKQLLAVVPLLLCAPVVWWLGRRIAPATDPGAGGWERLAFHMGCLVFLGTFVIANNWDYRLVFLLLTFPQLFRLIREEEDPRAGAAAVALIAIVALLWIGALSHALGLMDELVTWATVAVLSVLIAASVPTPRGWVAGLRAG